MPAGKVPAGMALAQVAGDFEIAEINARNGFPLAADAALAALRGLERGTLEVGLGVVRLKGEASNPEALRSVETSLQTVPAGWQILSDVVVLDDGLPIAYQITFDPSEGVRLSGKTPTDIDLDRVADALEFDEVSGASDLRAARAGGDPAVVLALLNEVQPYLVSVDRLRIEASGNSAKGELVPAGTVDGTALQEMLPNWDVVVDDQVVTNGAERFNLLTGRTEVFRNVAWVPLLRFEANEPTCAALTDRLQGQAGRIGFLSGSAGLDVASVAVINQLAAIAGPCVDAGLTLQVAGHTDDTGTPEANQDLSTARARAVAEALIARGVPSSALSALGFGQSQPVATNATPEGRAANRRTELNWRVPE